jgi:hypothetical protein
MFMAAYIERGARLASLASPHRLSTRQTNHARHAMGIGCAAKKKRKKGGGPTGVTFAEISKPTRKPWQTTPIIMQHFMMVESYR